jgi:hypothetical protein
MAAPAFGLLWLLWPAIAARADDEQPTPDSDAGWHFLPDTRIFEPRLADPRWPHFSLAYERRIREGTPRFRDAATVVLGEHIGMVEYLTEGGARFGLGLQPAVFALFNLDAPSDHFVNADYRLGIPFDFRTGPFSLEAAVTHQSSHLGSDIAVDDEQLSYECATLDASVDVDSLRLYAGFGHLIHSYPTRFAPWSARQGIEWSLHASDASFGPVAAVHLEEHEETGWQPDLSVRAGVEFIDPHRTRRRFQILLEYYRGHDPTGQFFHERIESVGIGIHFYF